MHWFNLYNARSWAKSAGVIQSNRKIAMKRAMSGMRARKQAINYVANQSIERITAMNKKINIKTTKNGETFASIAHQYITQNTPFTWQFGKVCLNAAAQSMKESLSKVLK